MLHDKDPGPPLSPQGDLVEERRDAALVRAVQLPAHGELPAVVVPGTAFGL